METFRQEITEEYNKKNSLGYALIENACKIISINPEGRLGKNPKLKFYDSDGATIADYVNQYNKIMQGIINFLKNKAESSLYKKYK